MPQWDANVEPQIHVGDTGTELLVRVVDQDGAPVNVSGASSLLILLTRPDRTVLTKTAVTATGGVDGVIKCTTVSGDLSAAGRWRIQGRVAGAGGWSGSTREVEFQVFQSRQGA